MKVKIPSKSKYVANEFIGVIYRCVGEGLLTGAEITQRQLHHQSQHNMGDSL